MADLNALIAQGAQFRQPTDPFAQYAQMQQLQTGQNQNALAQYQLAQAQRQDMQQNAMNQAYAGAVDPATGKIDYAKVSAAAAAGGAGSQIPGIQKHQYEVQKAAADLAKVQEETRASQMKAVGTGLTMALGDPSDAGLDRAFSLLDAQGIDTKPFRTQFAGITDPMQRTKVLSDYARSHPEGIAALNFVKPDPIEVKLADGSIKFIDKNPNSPTFKQEIVGMGQASGMTPFQKADIGIKQAQLGVAQSGLGLRAITTDPFNLAGAQTKFPLGAGGGGGAPAVPSAAPTIAPAPSGGPTLGGGKVSLATAIQNGVSGTDLLAVMPKALAAQVAAITDHRAAPPQRNTSRGDQITQLVQLVDPTYDATSFKTKQGIETAFTSGRLGTTLKSLNVVQDHLGVFKDTAAELKNNDAQFINAMGNKIAQWTGQPAPTNFGAVKTILSDELTKAILGTAGALGDRTAMQAEINAANSPAQLTGVVDKWEKLIAGQVKGLRDQYASGGGSNPAVKALFSRATTAAGGTAQAAHPADIQAIIDAQKAK